jgi:hypothetical protein
MPKLKEITDMDANFCETKLIFYGTYILYYSAPSDFGGVLCFLIFSRRNNKKSCKRSHFIRGLESKEPT